MTSIPQKKTEFISNENGEFRMRIYSYEYIQKDGEIYRVSKSGYLFLIEFAEHLEKPWIRLSFERERKFQKRKALAIGLQNSNIPSYERRAFKKRMGWVGA
ncbi:hypothetical protein F938_00462 [Acinetobacter bereziniae LMG 1003 = CIP 70.12]|jgi:hypothetical protein|uniref:Uncharacterized protein n=2 Tax=Acinetobacter bereziniae TaxID=106648 RepID=A0A8B5S0A4_ACIBZ|nr:MULTISPECIES: hypothetical protein [Acinetobacter]ELW85861.1 hypothetical protein ACINWC743_2347 [Acinetobacter sp. WC-743]ENW00946.1 hypothetical protein F938_00462 [Acinetobacter bereziniae LMG 1003 = CIP 70.12]KKW80403.1 hypothetical protein AAV97_05145 [Acinetobacter sp. Ag2]MBJ8426725.1 hypothetical protein [Acinetobacter bereziniae]MBJ8475804.1 hypothetical protein [Acinetobacter bereziniae]